MKRRLTVCLSVLCLVSVALAATSCGGRLRRELAGGATTSGRDVLDTSAPAPREIWVADFRVDDDSFKKPQGLVSEVLDNRPHILQGGTGRGGVLGGRIGSSDAPDPSQVVDQLAASVAEGLTQQNLGFPVERLAPGQAVPSTGWLVRGDIVSVDPGNRAERAVVGFGAGEATAEVQVEVDRLEPGRQVPVMRFGTQSDSGKAPGAVVTMNPYVAAAKFVIGKNATSRDINAIGAEIAKQIADYARSRGVAAR